MLGKNSLISLTMLIMLGLMSVSLWNPSSVPNETSYSQEWNFILKGGEYRAMNFTIGKNPLTETYDYNLTFESFESPVNFSLGMWYRPLTDQKWRHLIPFSFNGTIGGHSSDHRKMWQIINCSPNQDTEVRILLEAFN